MMTQDEKDKIISDTLDKVEREFAKWWLEEYNRRCELVKQVYGKKITKGQE